VYGYILQGLEGTTGEETQKLNQAFREFYDKKIKKNFDFDRDELHLHYSQCDRYPFEEIYPKVTREVV
jgi:hypothetical protein